jgi:hypothetical protein
MPYLKEPLIKDIIRLGQVKWVKFARPEDLAVHRVY